MKVSITFITVLIVLVGLVSLSQAASIQGVVTDANSGLPVENASINAFGFDPTNPDSIIYRTTSGVDGSYSFNNVIPATYYLWCEHPNYFYGSQSNVVINDSTSSVTVDFNLAPRNGGITNEVGGIVYSVSRNLPAFIPLDGANVNLTGNGVVFSTVSDSGGLYNFTDLPTGLYIVSADAPGHDPANNIDSVWVDVNTFIIDLDIYLMLSDSSTGSMSLAGYVYEVDSSGVVGSPVHPATVSIYSINPIYGYYTTVTNPDGSYLIENIIPAIYDAVCEAPGYFPDQVAGIDLSTANATQDFHLIADNGGSGTAILTGFVWGDSTICFPSVPIYPATISILGHTSTGDSLIYRTINNPDGSYLISGIIPGTYTAWCTAPGYQSQFIQNFVISDSINWLDFYLTPTGPAEHGLITGSVFSDSSGAPVPWAFIEFISSNGFNYNSMTDINGNYSSPPLPVGDYYVACYVMSLDSNFFYMEYYDDAHSLADATVLTVTQNDTIQNIDFGIPTSTNIANVTVTGNVRDNNNLPMENALVTAWSYRNPGIIGDSLHFHTFTDAQGNYTINMTHNFPQFAFSFFVSAEKQGYEVEFWQEKSTPWEADQIWVFGDTTITGIDFTLEPFGGTNSISGFITSDAGYPLTNAFIIGADINNGQIVFTFSDSAGYYELSSLNESYYYLLFTATGHIPEFYDDVYVWENATPVYAAGTVSGIDASLAVLTTNPGTGIISGTVLNNSNQPLSGVLLAIKNSTGNVIGYDMTDNQGVYEVAGVSDGDHEVSASIVSYTSEIQNVTFNSSTHNTLLVNFDLNQTTTDIPDKPKEALPTTLELMSNFPNPFNPDTKISFRLPSSQNVKLVIYNVLGQLVNELVNNELPAGTHTFVWNGTDAAGKTVSTGIYFYSIETDNQKIVKKMIFSK